MPESESQTPFCHPSLRSGHSRQTFRRLCGGRLVLDKNEGPLVKTLRYSSRTEAIEYLCGTDDVLAGVIDAVGPYELQLGEDRFQSLARSIVGQQLSVTAARTIWGRVVALVGPVEPGALVAIDDGELRACGLSKAKTTYVKDLARLVLEEQVYLDRLDGLSDGEVVEELTKVKGIGRWTAEMFLIFSLGRQDVLSVADVGLQRATSKAYSLPNGCGPGDLARIGTPWQPYRSVASLYLWEALDTGVL